MLLASMRGGVSGEPGAGQVHVQVVEVARRLGRRRC
jgi:hypothetical protein